jgi:hypothetical protein
MNKLFSFWQLACVGVLMVINLIIGLDYGSDYYRNVISWSWKGPSCVGTIPSAVDDQNAIMDLPMAQKTITRRTGCTVRSIPINANMTLDNVQLPLWLKEYFAWHAQRLASIEQHNLPWTQEKVLVSRCFEGDVCGGTADRLREFHNLIAAAARTRRLLFIVWTRPMALQEFLQPGPLLNWTLPDALQQAMWEQQGNVTTKAYRDRASLEDAVEDPTKWVVEAALQTGSDRTFRDVNLERGNQGDAETFLKDGFHNLWWGVFTPSPPLLMALDKAMQHLDLWPNEFVFAHYRAGYPGEAFQKTGDLKILEETTINAIHCALSTVAGDGERSNSNNYPVYMASDNVLALGMARNYSQQHNGRIRIVTHLDLPRTDFDFLADDQHPPHLNFVNDATHAATFYPVFLDLLMFSLSRGASYGSGGFGRLGSRISYNFSGFVEHTVGGKVKHCESPKARLGME